MLYLILINNVSDLLKSATPIAEEKTADYISLKILFLITLSLINIRIKNLAKLGWASSLKVKIIFLGNWIATCLVETSYRNPWIF